MFCMNCGKQLPDGAKFCRYCGTPQDDASVETAPSVININQSTKLVPGTCTNCGASLQVDPNQQAAICPACGTPYIVQQAINNFNIHSSGNISIENAVITVPGANAENYVKRAIGLEQQYDLEKALEFYNKALDADADNKDALVSVARINELMDDYCYKVGNANLVFSSGKMMLKRNKLQYITTKGKVTTYDISLMTEIKVHIGCLEFVYNGNKDRPVAFGGGGDRKPDEWVAVLTKAKMGEYPRITKDSLLQQPNYKTYNEKLTKFLSSKGINAKNEGNGSNYSVVLTNVNDSKMGIIKAYKDFTSCDLKKAREIIESAPVAVYSTTSQAKAAEVASLFREAGATVEIK